MKLYTLTITAHVDDLETLKVRLDAELEVDAESLRPIATAVLPAHLRWAADHLDDTEGTPL